MTENRRERIYIVYHCPRSPQDIVENCLLSGRTVVDKLQFFFKSAPRKSLENKAFF